jgi:hypothetical protein
MHKSVVLLPVLFIAGGVLGFGAVPVARVISLEPVTIDGIQAPARNYFPVALGGDVRSGSAPAVVQFADGGSVSLAPNSEIRIAGKAGKPLVHVIHGSAIYQIGPNFGGSVSRGDSSHSAAGAIGGYTLAQVGKAGQSNSVLTASAMYLGSVGQPANVIAPSSAISSGAFGNASGVMPGSIIQGVFSSSPRVGGSGGPEIILPGGGGAEVINLTAVTNPTTGVTVYTVASITQEVITPTGPTFITITGNSPLIGATIGGITGATPSGSSAQISFTPSGTSTPLSPAQVVTAIIAVQTTAIAQAPAGSTASVLTSVSTGIFSASAS